MPSVRAKILASCLSLTAGCGTVGHAAFVCPEKGGDPWSELSSTHFVLRTDLERPEAEEVIAQLEGLLAAISDIGFGSSKLPNTRVEVVHFRHHEEGLSIAPRYAGAFSWTGVHDFERTPLTMVHGPFDEATKTALRHELTHLLIHYHYPQAPTWLNEGLAQYYQTLEMEDGVAILGDLAPRHCFWEGRWMSAEAPGGAVNYIPVSEAPPAEDIMGLDGDGFYGPPLSDANDWSAFTKNHAMSVHYAAAFSLVRLLLVSPVYEKSFAEYLKRLQNGSSHADAWETSVGALGAQKLEADYRAWLIPKTKTARRTPYRPSHPVAQNARAMSDVEVHVLWARLRDWRKPKERAMAESDLTEASAREPTNAELALARAAMSVEEGSFSQAEKTLIAAARTPDRRLLNALGRVRLEALAASGKTKSPEIAAALGPIATKLEPVAQSAAELDLLGRYRGAKGEVKEGLELERRALLADPTCYSCMVIMAQLLYAGGRPEEALEAIKSAFCILPEGVPSGPLLEQLAFYRRRLREKGGDKARAPSSTNGAASSEKHGEKGDRN